jgi:spermidine dehydrogenase
MSETKDLGLEVSIKRRDFVGGVAAALGFLSAGGAGAGESPAGESATGISLPTGPVLPDAAHYPPLRSGLRGQYPGSLTAQVRDGVSRNLRH